MFCEQNLKNIIIYALDLCLLSLCQNYAELLGKTNKQIQQITGGRSLAQEILELTCLLGIGSHSLAVIFYLSPQDVLLHSLLRGPWLPVHVPTAAEEDHSSVHWEASESRGLLSA